MTFYMEVKILDGERLIFSSVNPLPNHITEIDLRTNPIPSKEALLTGLSFGYTTEKLEPAPLSDVKE